MTRLSHHATASTALSLLSDRGLGALVAQAPVVRTGIGGTAAVLEVDGVRVFAKRIPLTDLERRPEHVLSTANLFELPAFYQYGVGSAGFGVWRELAAHVMTTNWVLGGQCANFPLLYHWRVVDGPIPTAQEHEDLERSVEYWDGSPAVRDRLEAITRATASVVLFLEFIPHSLAQWLPEHDAEPAVTSLLSTLSFLRANGMVHFDAHPGNVLADRDRVYLTDFGLTTSTRFDLSTTERAFLERHRDYDEHHAMSFLLGRAPSPTVERYAASAAVMREFYRRQKESRAVLYPWEEIGRISAA
jgi:hypothetical protein